MHWSTEIASKLAERGGRQVIETGTSISGIPHVGNASDVIRGDAVRKACINAGLDVELIWVADDSDPFRKVPEGMDSLKDYLGFPVKDIPDPHGCHKSFVDHFVEGFIGDLAEFGVEPKIYSGTDLYRDGSLNEGIETAFQDAGKIRDILNKFRREPLPDDWIPWTPICSSCGRISTTRVTGVDGMNVSYVCESTEISGGKATGCGHEGVSDALKGEGKLPWRVEWAARWDHFKVTCEPFGKEHATVGGSYDTSKIISAEIYGWEPPVPVIYEFFTLNKDKISSSKGNVITLADWLGIAEPEVLKYFMYKRLAKQRDINLKVLTNLVDEYDNAERSFFAGNGDEDAVDIYRLSQVGEPRPLSVPFTLCAVLSQIIPASDTRVMIERAGLAGYVGFDGERLVRRVRLAGNWVEKYGPEYLLFRLNSIDEAAKEYAQLDDPLKACLKHLAGELGKDVSPKDFHKLIYETARANDVEPPELFKAIYQSLIGKEKGPKAAMFLLSLGRDYLNSVFP
ncbi:lysine--tRNA ligase [Candidatus Altiarchaeota archaeon]